MPSHKDEIFIARAIALAKKGVFTTDPNPNVGCVVAKDDRIIAEGWHHRAGEAHAEINAINAIEDAEGSTVYVTLEPCSHTGKTGPCSQALIQAGVKRVVIGMLDPNPLVSGRGIAHLKDAGINVECGLLQQAAESLNLGFIKRMRKGLPYIRSKLAMSLDGRTAMASGESQWITSPLSRADVQKHRASSSVVLTGINTVIADNPSLLARVDFELKQPVRVILDTQLRIPLEAKILNDNGETWVLTCHDDEHKIKQIKQKGHSVFILPENNNHVDLFEAFELLADKQINTVWIEAGAKLNGSLIKSGLVDEWVFYQASCILGDHGKGLFELSELHRLSDKFDLQMTSHRMIGHDTRITFQQIKK